MLPKVLFFDRPDLNLFGMFKSWFPTRTYEVSCVSSTVDLTRKAGEVDVVVIFAYNNDVFHHICAALKQVESLPKIVFFTHPSDREHLKSCLQDAQITNTAEINAVPLSGANVWLAVRKSLRG